jgi:excisionase family DNA binding protein
MEHAGQRDSRRLTDYAGLHRYLGGAIAMSTLRQMVHTGRLPHVRIGERSPRFDLDAIDAWLAERSTGGAR